MEKQAVLKNVLNSIKTPKQDYTNKRDSSPSQFLRLTFKLPNFGHFVILMLSYSLLVVAPLQNLNDLRYFYFKI